MSDRLVIDEEIGEDGTLILNVPPDGPRGLVRIIIEQLAENDLSPTAEAETALDAELEALLTGDTIYGLGLTAGEIANSPAFGIWADREDISDSAEFVETMRRSSSRRRSQHED